MAEEKLKASAPATEAAPPIPWTQPRNRFGGPKDARPSLKGGRPPSMLDQLDGELERRVLAAPGAPAERTVAPGRPVEPPAASAAEEVAAARLRQLERLLRTQETELRRQEREISKLQADKVQLQRDNREMQLFLADYGMRWVGGSKDAPPPEAQGVQAVEDPAAEGRGASVGARAATGGGGSSSSFSSSSSSCAPAAKAAASPVKAPSAADGSPLKKRVGPPDMETVRTAVHELNELADASSEVVRREDGSHGIQASQSTLGLTFWRNGMQVEGGELRAYGTPQCAGCLEPPPPPPAAAAAAHGLCGGTAPRLEAPSAHSVRVHSAGG